MVIGRNPIARCATDCVDSRGRRDSNQPLRRIKSQPSRKGFTHDGRIGGSNSSNGINVECSHRRKSHRNTGENRWLDHSNGEHLHRVAGSIRCRRSDSYGRSSIRSLRDSRKNIALNLEPFSTRTARGNGDHSIRFSVGQHNAVIGNSHNSDGRASSSEVWSNRKHSRGCGWGCRCRGKRRAWRHARHSGCGSTRMRCFCGTKSGWRVGDRG